MGNSQSAKQETNANRRGQGGSHQKDEVSLEIGRNKGGDNNWEKETNLLNTPHSNAQIGSRTKVDDHGTPQYPSEKERKTMSEAILDELMEKYEDDGDNEHNSRENGDHSRENNGHQPNRATYKESSLEERVLEEQNYNQRNEEERRRHGGRKGDLRQDSQSNRFGPGHANNGADQQTQNYELHEYSNRSEK
jgi:hypothetical protein